MGLSQASSQLRSLNLVHMNLGPAETAVSTYQLKGVLSSVAFCVCSLCIIVYIHITLLLVLKGFLLAFLPLEGLTQL